MEVHSETLNKNASNMTSRDLPALSRISRWQNVKNLLSLADISLIVAAMFGLYFLLAYQIVCQWKILPAGRLRVVEMKAFLENNYEIHKFNKIYFLGSSIPLEGIDCNRIDTVFPKGIECYNLSWTGSGPRQWLLMLPSLRRTKPSCVVLFVDVGMLMPMRPIPDDLLTVAAWWGLIPKEQLEIFSPQLSQNEIHVLKASSFRHLLAFRSLPFDALNSYMSETCRRDLRYEGYTTNYKSPWVRRGIAPPEATARGVAGIQQTLSQLNPGDLEQTLAILEFTIQYLKAEDCQVRVFLAPTNPALTADMEKIVISNFRQKLLELAKQNEVRVIDHSGLLKADEFSDHVHPNSAGREVWSKEVGNVLSSDVVLKEKIREVTYAISNP